MGMSRLQRVQVIHDPKDPMDPGVFLEQLSLADPAVMAGSAEGLSVRNRKNATALGLNALDRFRQGAVAHHRSLSGTPSGAQLNP